jgi:hypothetical protein
VPTGWHTPRLPAWALTPQQAAAGLGVAAGSVTIKLLDFIRGHARNHRRIVLILCDTGRAAGCPEMQGCEPRSHEPRHVAVPFIRLEADDRPGTLAFALELDSQLLRAVPSHALGRPSRGPSDCATRAPCGPC